MKTSLLAVTAQGRLEGAADASSGSLSWLGIPYAEPPVGNLRFRAPVPKKSWEGVRKADAFGPVSVQRAKDGSVVGSEDCLYLNVWRPEGEEEGLPVFFFLHGGNNQTGSGQDLRGGLFAQKLRAVVVSPTFRLNAPGWLALPALKTGDPLGDSGNLGLLDIRQALLWVHENIRAFGGDPECITACGYSSGGRNLLCMLLSPYFKGLFARAMTFSSGFTVTDPDFGVKTDAAALAPLAVEDGLAPDREAAFRLLTAEDEASMEKVRGWLLGLDEKRFGPLMAGAAIRMRVFPHLFADGTLLPKEGFGVLERGFYHHVPLLFLSGGNEFVFQANNDPHFKGKDLSDPELLEDYRFAARFGSALFGYTNAEHNAEEFLKDKDHPPVWTGRCLWGMDPEVTDADAALRAGGSHGLDLYLLMDIERDDYALTEKVWSPENRPGRNALRETYFRYLTNFIRTGDPNRGPGGDGGFPLPRWDSWTDPEHGFMMCFDAGKEEARVHGTDRVIREPEVFAAIRADRSIPEDRRNWLLKNVLNARFFSDRLDREIF